MKLKIVILLILISTSIKAQVEHIPAYHPVYAFLLRAETKGFLPNTSLSELPWSKGDIQKALRMIKNHKLSEIENEVLNQYLQEFDLENNHYSANLLISETDTTALLFDQIFSDREKYIYKYSDSSNKVYFKPLVSIEYWQGATPKKENVILGNLGINLSGSLGSHVGYSLQVTNGVVFSGEKELAMHDSKLSKNVKFADLNSDFDFTQSHVAFEYNWFRASIGRETRLSGSGIYQRLFISDNSPDFDAITLGAKFSNFEYRFLHGSLLGLGKNSVDAGFNAEIPQKYVAQHKFSFKPSWGEISFWENITYSDRPTDLAYFNPLSFYKSLEHALRDRDNSIMGLDFTLRPFDGLQLKGSYLLDDIIFSKIGTGYWSNKSAWNIAAISSALPDIDLGIEYSRVEPYTYTHFNKENSYTNDGLMYGSILLPNSDSWSALLRLWWTKRYPLDLKISYIKHGANVYDENGELLKNVGGDPLQTRRPEDSETVEFLDGDKTEYLSFSLAAGYEVTRALNLNIEYSYMPKGYDYEHLIKLILRLYEF
jgi:hypothetical protein